MQNIKQAMQLTLENAGIAYEHIAVFGAVRCNVHITCICKDTAEKWVILLSQVFNGAKVSCVETIWDAKENKGTTLRITKRKGFLIAVAA